MFSAIGKLNICFFIEMKKESFWACTVKLKPYQDAKKAIEQFNEADLDKNVINMQITNSELGLLSLFMDL